MRGAADATLCKPLLAEQEARFYTCAERLSRGLCRIIAKPRLRDFLRSTNGREGWATFEEAGRKHIDFLLCRHEDWFPMVGVELFDADLESVHLHGRDVIVTSIFKTVGLPLLRVEHQELASADTLLKKLSNAWATREQYLHLEAQAFSRSRRSMILEAALPPVPAIPSRTPNGAASAPIPSATTEESRAMTAKQPEETETALTIPA